MKLIFYFDRLESEDEMDLGNDSMVEKLTETEIICDGKITLHRLNSIFHSELPEEEEVIERNRR